MIIMTRETAIEKLLEVRALVLASFEGKKWVPLHLVAKHIDAAVIEAMEAHGLVEVKVGHNKPTTFRVKAEGYKLATMYR